MSGSTPQVPERQRDCRGCHDYSKTGTRDPQNACTKCHFSDDQNHYQFVLQADDESFLTSLESLRTAGSLFQHHNHLALQCRECHAVGGSTIEAPILMPKRGGLELCLECHVGQKPRQSQLHFVGTHRDGSVIDEAYKVKALAKLPRGIAEALNGTPAMGPNRPGEVNVAPFRHADHILPEHLGNATSLADLKAPGEAAEFARQANCGICHGPVFDAQSTSGAVTPAPFSQAPENCGACHVSDAAGTVIEFRVESKVLSSPTAGTFSHADHLNFEHPSEGFELCAEAGYRSIEEEGCAACHVPDPGVPSGYGLKGALDGEDSFKGCQECHSVAAWAPSEHGEWWTPENHGSWQTCTPCHDPTDADFLTNRPTSEISRRRPGLFRVETQVHRHITVSAGQAIEETCADCHRQPVAQLPSRIQETAFKHSSHLPPSPDSASCAPCHDTTVIGAETAMELGAGATTASTLGPKRVYDEGACAACHLGSEPIPEHTLESSTSQPSEPTRPVPSFSHAAHIGKTIEGGAVVGCTTCHTLAADAPSGDNPSDSQLGGMTTLPAALDCTLCHGHSGTEARRLRTGQGIAAAEVAACASCHAGGLPVDGAVPDVATAGVSDIVGPAGQFHPPVRTAPAAISRGPQWRWAARGPPRFGDANSFKSHLRTTQLLQTARRDGRQGGYSPRPYTKDRYQRRLLCLPLDRHRLRRCRRGIGNHQSRDCH